MDFQEKIKELLAQHVRGDIALEIPPDPCFGHFAFPCFILAKEWKKNPAQIAQEIAQKLPKQDFIEKIAATGPYVNFFIDKQAFITATLTKILNEKEQYGSSRSGKGKKALIEHTSINPNASPHMGRARNALIGDALVRLLRFEGYATDVHYFVNDVGKQIAMLVYGCKDSKKVTFEQLLNVYVGINNRAESDKSVEEEVFALLKSLENKDEAIVKRFRQIVNTCIDGQAALLKRLGITYDSFDYESEFLWNGDTEKALAKLKESGRLFEDGEGRLVLDLKEFNLVMKTPVLVLTRNDKTSLYPLRDIAYSLRKAKLASGRNIIVLGEDQKLYLQQLHAALSLLDAKAPEPVHYSFVLLSEGKMSTRKGNLVLLSDFMQEAVSKAEKELLKREPELSWAALKKKAEAIGFGALKYSILKVSPEKNVTFDWSSALRFEGDTGPYLQYTYARLNSILAKNKTAINGKKAALLLREDKEAAVIRILSQFPNSIAEASHQLRPHIIANYAYTLAQAANELYHRHPVLKAENDIKDARIVLLMCVNQVLKTALSLLGISVLE